MLVVLEGIDGAGKTTLAAGLRDRLAGAGLGDVELWRKKDHSFAEARVRARLAVLHDLIWGDPSAEPEQDLLGTQHYLFLHAAWFGAITTNRVRPLRADPSRSAVVDGWYYRSVVKAVIRGGVDEDWALSLFENGDAPDVVLLVDVDPAVAWQRRDGAFSASELGRWDGRGGEPEDAFLSYQSVVRTHLTEMAARRSWAVIRPDASWSPDRVLEHAFEEVERRLTVDSVPRDPVTTDAVR